MTVTKENNNKNYKDEKINSYSMISSPVEYLLLEQNKIKQSDKKWLVAEYYNPEQITIGLDVIYQVIK